MWTPEAKQRALTFGPMGPGLLRRADTRVIERPGWHQVITPSSPGGVMNEIAYSQVDASDAERVIDEALALYGAHGLTFRWRVGPWTRPADFGARLEARGFAGHPTRGMVVDTARAIDVPADVEIVEVDAATLDEYVPVFVSGWGLTAEQIAPLRADHIAAMNAEPRVARFFAARVDGALVATTALLLRDTFGYLVGAQVLEAYRGRGIYRGLIAARLQHLHERGLTLAVTQAREATSAPMLEHLGFESVSSLTVYLRDT